jgi:hypothetical protein
MKELMVERNPIDKSNVGKTSHIPVPFQNMHSLWPWLKQAACLSWFKGVL